ncbi:hypothetical protein [Nonomuraea muscovyensis]|uniref:hypothetical protein n=1 Tax=Nonomuraea muscovyensis TaxID=1124761 RepID=UPI00161ABC86|nr:hypothetical protein [Nonomuraea muscovyensis]
MSPPENTKAAPARERLSNSMTIKATNDKTKVHNGGDKRNTPGRQLPLVRSATAYPPAWGMVTALIVLDSECECGYYHAHRVKAPAPALLRRTARCGTKYELYLHAPRARRTRRAA